MGHRRDAQMSLSHHAWPNPARARINPDCLPPSARELAAQRRRDWNEMMGIEVQPTYYVQEMHHS